MFLVFWKSSWNLFSISYRFCILQYYTLVNLHTTYTQKSPCQLAHHIHTKESGEKTLTQEKTLTEKTFWNWNWIEMKSKSIEKNECEGNQSFVPAIYSRHQLYAYRFVAYFAFCIGLCQSRFSYTVFNGYQFRSIAYCLNAYFTLVQEFFWSERALLWVIILSG